jgi:hypothetical protein
MPEVLVVGLVVLVAVLFAVIWLIDKILQGIHGAVQSADKQFHGFIGNAQNKRFQRKRDLLAIHVSNFIPDELQVAERHIQSVQTQFDRLKRASVWTPERPRWDRLEFMRYNFPDQGSATKQFNVFDVHAILHPNGPSWQQQEQELLSHPCGCPALLHTVNRNEFREFSITSLNIAPALFAVAPGAVDDKDLEKYFSKERNAVTAYNKQRDELLAKYDTLVSSITTWNREERTRWLQYKDKCDTLQREELALFQKQSKKYETDCNEQRAEISQTLDGFRAKVKLFVLKRVDQILASLNLPPSLPRFWNLDYDEAEQILIAEIARP